MNNDYIEIIGAKENNLKDISINIPKNKLVTITGLSGSGKSTLAFDVLYNEGRRRYMDSLSSYARSLLGGVAKPNVEQINGLSPAIAIDQKSTNNNPRSTVATITEIADYLRLLWARIGTPFCPTHKIPITAQTTKYILDKIYEKPEGTKLQILAPIIRGQKGEFVELFAKLRREGFLRVNVDGEVHSLDDDIKLKKTISHDISIVVDRIVLSHEERSRINEAIETGATYADGLILVIFGEKDEELFSKKYACRHGDFTIPELEPRIFSFNTPFGACEACHGLGHLLKPSIDRIVPDKSLSINQGAIVYYKNTMQGDGIEWSLFKQLLESGNIDMDKPFNKLSKADIEVIMVGSKEPVEYSIATKTGIRFDRNEIIEGVGTMIARRYLETSSESAREWYKDFMQEEVCNSCEGTRYNESARSVKIGGLNIHEFGNLSIGESLRFVEEVKLDKMQSQIAAMVLNEAKQRLQFLLDVGLDYLSLNRQAGTLSGGESQRIRLATQIGTKLSGVIYVLDEPSIGLHQKDNTRLIDTLKLIRDLGNTVVVVEHDEETILASDYVIDVGPGAGNAGGEIIFKGTPDELMKSNTLTGQYLSFKKEIPVPKSYRQGNGKELIVEGARENNLKNIRVVFPLGKMIVVTGVSGSGKSTLVNQILCAGIEKYLNPETKVEIGKHDKIIGLENIDKIVKIGQDPIGRTPRSNPATYTKVFDEIRNIMADTPLAKEKGFTKSHFSFNVPGGRCEKCQGDGLIQISMNFLPDVYITCDDCDGKRYGEEVLSIKYKEKNINDILEMQISQAVIFWENVKKISVALQCMIDVGLGYLKMGHPATVLSGGEAQRIKLAAQLQKKSTGKTVYVLDEPTVGLHMHDVHNLVNVLSKMADNGDTLVIIEHNLDLIKVADHIIDIGREGGVRGGEIVTQGTPEKIMQSTSSYTGDYLKMHINRKPAK